MGSHKNNLKKQKGARHYNGNSDTRPDYNKPKNIKRGVLIRNKQTHKVMAGED